jgi:hypothetical protein
MSRPLLHVVIVVLYSVEKGKFTEIGRNYEVIMSLDEYVKRYLIYKDWREFSFFLNLELRVAD